MTRIREEEVLGSHIVHCISKGVNVHESYYLFDVFICI